MRNIILSILKCVCIICVFWLLVFFGPALVSLINTFDTIFYGLGYREGSLGYQILSFVSQPISCAIASSVAENIFKEEHNICVFVNDIIAICVFVLLAIYMFFVLKNIWLGFVYVVSAVTLIYCSARLAQNFSKNKD